MTHFCYGLIYQSVLSNLHISRKNSETCTYTAHTAFVRPSYLFATQKWEIIQISAKLSFYVGKDCSKDI